MHSRLADVSSIVYGKSPSEVVDDDGAVPIMGTGGEYGRASRAMFEAGVVVPRKGSLGNPQLSLGPFWATDTTFAVLPSKDVDARWLYYCLLNYDLSKLNEATGVPSISRDWLEKISFFNPGFPKQTKIADILQTIDHAIEKSQALIDKYQQIKTGLMHDLFTRGIGPDGQLRPPRERAPELYQETSIGWIPREWEIRSLGSLIGAIESGWSPNCDTDSAPEGAWGVLKTTAVVWDGYIPSENKRLPDSMVGKQSIETKSGDLLITRKGPVDRVGVAVFVPNTPSLLMFPDTVFRTRLLSELEVSSAFLALFLQSKAIQRYWGQRKVGLAEAQVNLNHGILRNTPIALASKVEQSAVLARYNAIQSKISVLKDNVKKYQKIKAGLMHDLLTGKVPVRVDAVAEPEAAHA